MNQEQNDEFSMLKDIQGFFNIPANGTKISTIADIVSAKTELDNHITYIDTNKVISDADNKGITGNKGQLRAKLQTAILVITGPLANLGRTTHDDVLLQRYSIVPTDLNEMRENDLVTFATQTVIDGNANLLALGGSGVTAAKITDVTTANAAFGLVIATPGQAKQAKKLSNQNIKAAFPQTRTLIDVGFTPLMRSNFFTTDIDFFKLFLESTLITTTGVHHLDFFGLIIDGSTGLPVHKAVIRVLNPADVVKPELAKDPTGPKGHFAIKEVPPGTWSVEISRAGYTTLVIPNVSFVEGISRKALYTIQPI